MARNWIQRLAMAALPKSWRESMERESRAWKMVCPCGRTISIWDAGGIRWKAAGNPVRLARCPQCGLTWHELKWQP